MAKENESARGLPLWVYGGVAAALVALLGVWAVSRDGAGSEEITGTGLERADALQPAMRPSAEADPTADQSQDPPSGAAAPSESTGVDAQTDISEPGPRLDELRLDPGGIAVVAGRARPGKEVVLRADGIEIGRAVTDARGAFATVALIEPSAELRVLTLAELDGSGKERLSDDEFILAPVLPAERAPQPEAEQVAAPETTPDAETADARAVAALSQSDQPDDTRARDALPQALTPSQERTATKAGDTALGSETEASSQGMASQETAPLPAPSTQVPSSPAMVASDDLGQQKPRATTAPRLDTAHITGTPRTLPNGPNHAAPKVAGLVANTQARLSGGQDTPTPPDAPLARARANAVTAQDAPRTPTNLIAVLRSTADGVEVVQSPAARPTTRGRVTLNAISYSATGDVQLAGQAPAAATEVRVYLNNSAVAALPVSQDGSWRGDVRDVASGVYTLRLDAVAPDGTVASRFESPFKREPPELLLASVDAEQSPQRAVTVQAGATLWAIARKRYGDPFLYVQVFEANRDQIRDPDLIYPGQVFALPAARN